MGSTSSETLPSSSACRTDQESSDQKEPNRSSTCGNEAFLFSCFKPKPKLTRKSDSDEVDKLTRFLHDDMEFISKVSEKIRGYKDEIQELKRTFKELQSRARNTTTDDYQVVGLAYELFVLQGNVANLKERMTAKEGEAKALRKMIVADRDFISKVSEKIETYSETEESLHERLKNFDNYGGTVVQLRDLKKKFTKEKQRITSNQNDGSKEEEEEEEEEPESTRYDQSRSLVTGTANIKGGHAALEKMPNLSKSSAVAESSVFKDFEARYNELRIELKQCLLCFSVFPENAKIKKRVMTYWWIGEGFVPPIPTEKKEHNNHNNRSSRTREVSVPPPNKEQNNNSSSSSKTAEEYANDFFYELIAKDFIEPSSKSSPGLASLVGVKTCKMNPFVRSMLIVLAKRVNFFDFDDDMNVTADYTSSHRACLTGKQLDFNTRDLDSLHTLFNVSEPVLVFNPDSFRRMKYVKVLYLGRWQTWSTYHVDIVFLDVLQELGHAKDLRFLSLQRMSKMMELPATILKLENLTILDIRACQNLEEIPKDIGSLTNLTHLDMSECYLLDHMPKELSKLINLQVLGGFVVGEFDDAAHSTTHCTLADLQSMKKLRKLSIDTAVEKFPSQEQLHDLNKLGTLRKLTIAWGRGYAPKSSTIAGKPPTTSNNESKRKPPCLPRLKAPKCLWGKRNASPKENSAPEPSAGATEFGKDDSAPESLPTAEVGKDNTAPEAPATEEIEKDNSAPKPSPAVELEKDNNAGEPAPAADVRKDNSVPEPPPAEVGKDNSAPEPQAAEDGKDNSAPEAKVGKNDTAPEPPLTAEVEKDDSSPKSPLEALATKEEIGKNNSAPESAQAKEAGKDSKAPEATLADEVPKSNSAAVFTGAKEIGKDNSKTEPPTIAEGAWKNSSVATEEGEKDNSASKATSRVKEYEECNTKQEQEPAEVKATTTATVEEKYVCFPWIKAFKRSRVDEVKTQLFSTKADQTNTSIHDQSEAELPLVVGMDGHLHGQLHAKLPPKLEKLDLQCFPDNRDTEDWLRFENLPKLKKLYIRGGKCFDLGANFGAKDGRKGTNQPDPKEWQVEVLRLKYLSDLRMEWKELQRLFPKLSYLETVGCPKLSFFPCDENGVWMKKSL